MSRVDLIEHVNWERADWQALGYNSKEDMEIAANQLKIWERFGFHNWDDMELMRKAIKLIDNKDQYKEEYAHLMELLSGEGTGPMIAWGGRVLS